MTMKKMTRIFAVLLSVALLLCSFSFATNSTANYRDQTVNYSCTASSTTATAETCYPTVGMERSASISAIYRHYVNGRETSDYAGNSMSNYSGDAYTFCSYSGAISVVATSSHSVESWSGVLTVNWP